MNFLKQNEELVVLVLLAKIKEKYYMNFRYFRSMINLNTYKQFYEGVLIKFIKENLNHTPIMILESDFIVPMNILGYSYFNFHEALARHWYTISIDVKDKQDRQKLLKFLEPYRKED